MKIGSLVECLIVHPEYQKRGVNKGDIFTVRNIWVSPNPNDNGDVLLSFFEIKPEMLMGRERGYDIRDFREVQPPMDISELITETTPHECA